MSSTDPFEAQLEEALAAWEGHIEEAVLPQLKQCYLRMRSSFEALFTLMKKKGLVKPDPYNYEERISEVRVPSDTMFSDAERDQQLSIRTGQYLRQLEYLTDYFSFSLPSFTLKEIKSLASLTRYINWQGLSENAAQPTTRLLAEQVLKAKHATDQLSVNIIKDAQEQLSSASREALSCLKKITTLQRERYKLEFRKELLPALGSGLSPEELARQAKARWNTAMSGRPFARELIMEVAAENLPADGTAAREAVLQSLRVAAAPKEAKKGVDLRSVLLDGVRALAAGSRPLEEISQKLGDNAVIQQSRKVSFGEMLQAIWERMRGRDVEGHRYQVEYIDEKSQMRQVEEIHFEQFQADLTRKSRIYAGFLARSGASWDKLQNAPEEKILTFLTRETQEVSLMIRRSESLDTFFRGEVAREQRGRLRGINIEVTAIRDHLQKARKKAHDYVSKHDEIEQLRRLGINPDS